MSDTNFSPSFDETGGVTDGVDELALRRAASRKGPTASEEVVLDDELDELVNDELDEEDEEEDDDVVGDEIYFDDEDDDGLTVLDESPYDDYDDAAILDDDINDPNVEPSFVEDDDEDDDDDLFTEGKVR